MHPYRDLAARLRPHALALCRELLGRGTRQGAYWIVGNVRNDPGSSLFVRLHGSGPHAAGRWRDAATGEHGDLLDLIAAARGVPLNRAAEEARAWLGLHPTPVREDRASTTLYLPVQERAKRLLALVGPLAASPAARYLANRGLASATGTADLGFLPDCLHRDTAGRSTRHPALVARVRCRAGVTTGAHRTWITPDGSAKAAVSPPRKGLGGMAGGGVWIGQPDAALVVGEGLETTLALRVALPWLPMVAALSAAHMRVLRWPDTVRRLYVAADADAPGLAAAHALAARARPAGLDAVVIVPPAGDWNDQLLAIGAIGVRSLVCPSLAPQDRASAGP